MMNAYVVKVKPWKEVKRLAKEFGISMNGDNLKNRGKWGEYIKVSHQNEEGNYWYVGVKYYPWMLKCVDADEVLEYGRIIKEETIDNTIVRIVEFCDELFYIKTYTSLWSNSCVDDMEILNVKGE